MRENGNNETSIRESLIRSNPRYLLVVRRLENRSRRRRERGVRESYSRGDGDNGERCRRSDGVVQERVRE